MVGITSPRQQLLFQGIKESVESGLVIDSSLVVEVQVEIEPAVALINRLALLVQLSVFPYYGAGMVVDPESRAVRCPA